MVEVWQKGMDAVGNKPKSPQGRVVPDILVRGGVKDTHCPEVSEVITVHKTGIFASGRSTLTYPLQ